MLKQTIDIGGMTCGHCLGQVRSALGKLPGLTIETMRVGQATVNFDESETSLEAITGAIEEAGYDVLQAK